MPPSSLPTGLSRISAISQLGTFSQLPKIFLLALVAVTCIRLAVLHCTRRTRRSTVSSPSTKEKGSTYCQAVPETPLREHPRPGSKGQIPPTFNPIYPWTGPPQELPGPYDPRLYPLPTIRRHSHNPSPTAPMDTNSISYTRRVSTNSIPARQTTLRGTLTTSSNGTTGWRRNQWVVEGG
ncbi:hypothetical protein EJ04DRAFT_177328 [Polyplosphaeria fusca]|uniref:Uncharacterized protein n=1 Tax=Polyplosphaeria fusca TaxID=682080 RepID=A0A9P4QY68_9PLEO|nr:hypothetical protein EJ04DRAFT_177328 [Polyplosphaeria fusca]